MLYGIYHSLNGDGMIDKCCLNQSLENLKENLTSDVAEHGVITEVLHEK